MAKVLIDPVSTVTVGGFVAVVNGIDVVSKDLLMGKIYTSHYPEGIDVSWDSSGICRNNNSDCNIALNDGAYLEDLLQAALNLSGI